MTERRIVRVRESILKESRVQAADLRSRLEAAGVSLVNIMASPGAGKTSVILRTLDAFAGQMRTAVIEADLDSTVDADKIAAVGVEAVQIETGGFCHVDPAMLDAALGRLELDRLDLVLLENVGNLICTAQHETGAHVNVAILSVPEGDDKPLKYPVMFQAADAILINKMDYLELAEFDVQVARERIRVLNPDAPVFTLSCRTGDGVGEWVAWLETRVGPGTTAEQSP